MKKSFLKASMAMVLAVLLTAGLTVGAFAESINSAIDDAANWVTNDKGEISIADGKVSISGNGVVTSYLSSKYNEKMVEFTVTLDSLEKDNLLAVNTRHGNETGYFWGGEKYTYCAWIHKHSVEIQKWNGSQNILTVVEDTDVFTETGKEYKVEFGSIPVEGGVKVVLKVDGKTIVEAVDTEDIVPADGKYLTFYSWDPITIGKVAESAPAAGSTTAPAESTPASSASNPKTGDVGMIGYALTAIVGAGVVGLTIKRRKA